MENPVLNRELLERLRSGKTLSALAAVAVSSCLLIWLRWPVDATVDVINQGSLNVFRPLAYALATAVLLIIPAFPATALVRERQRRTLALLLHSPLSPLQIYLGKFGANLLLGMIVLAITLPAVVACYAMGGLSLWSQLVPLYVLLIALSVLCTSLGLWISSIANSTDASLRWTYGAVLGLTVVTLAPAVIMGGFPGWPGWFANHVRAFSPLPAIQELVGQSASATASVSDAAGWFWPFIACTSLLTIGTAGHTLFRLQPSLMDRSRTAGAVTEDKAASVRVIRRLFFLVDPNRRKAGIPLLINPVMVKEFRTRKFGRFHWLIRLVMVCAMISLALSVFAATGTVSWGVTRIAGAMVLFQVALLVLLGPSLAAGLISSERESGGWLLLRSTPLSATKIISGKLMSVVWTILLIMLATLPGYIVMVYIQPTLQPQVIRVLISLAVQALVVITVSAAISSCFTRTAPATATSYGVLLALFAGTLLIWLARDRPFGQSIVESALLFNPAAAALSEIRYPGFLVYDLIPGAWWIGIAISMMALTILLFRVWLLSRPD